MAKSKDNTPEVVAQTVMLPIGKLDENKGQVPGVPKNPRQIKGKRFQQLCASIKEDEELLNLRPLIVYPMGGRYAVIDGNMRLKALKELKYKEAPCEILKEGTTPEQMVRYISKTNSAFGDWDWDALANEWDNLPLDDWGLDLPSDWGVKPDNFGEDFELPEGDKSPFQQMSFVLADEQANVIKQAVKDAQHLEEYKYLETMGNANSNGNALYLIVKQWADARK